MTKILQISDTHVVGAGELAYGVVDTAAALAETVATINRRLPEIGPVDMVIVTGDLTEHGTAEEYDLFRTIMMPLEVPYRVVPGNHDRREAMRHAFAGEDWMPQDGPVAWSADFDDLTVVGLDSLREGRAAGFIEAPSLAVLDACLARLGGKPLIIAFHHPPFETGVMAMDRQNLLDPAPLLARIEAYPGDIALVCGHVHRSVTTLIGGRLCQIAPGTSHAVTLDQRENAGNSLTQEPGGMMLHEMRDGRIVSHLIPVGAYAGPSPFTGVASD